MSEIYRDREAISASLAHSLKAGPATEKLIAEVIRSQAKCYAGLLGTMRSSHNGHAKCFEEPQQFPGRMEKTASWAQPQLSENQSNPWLIGMPRLIFISDMGDALSGGVPFSFLRDEIIANVSSPEGWRHVWLWLTKRPARMARFGTWLLDSGAYWPDNLVAMTTITGPATSHRLMDLLQVPAKCRGLSLEPLFAPVSLCLDKIDWVIVGGGSDALAEPFHLEWASQLITQCKEARVACFVKQLGRNPYSKSTRLKLCDKHGGDWNQWPPELRVREMPEAFKRLAERTSTGRRRVKV
jgi:protein gp37